MKKYIAKTHLWVKSGCLVGCFWRLEKLGEQNYRCKMAVNAIFFLRRMKDNFKEMIINNLK